MEDSEDKDEHTGRALFPNSNFGRRREAVFKGSLGPAPDGALGITALHSQYPALINELDDLIDRLSREAKKRPGELVSVPFHDIHVHGGNYERWFSKTNHGVSTRIEPRNFREVLRPKLDAMIAQRKENRTYGGGWRAPVGYLGIRKFMPNTYGAMQLANNLKHALEDAVLTGKGLQEDGSYKLNIDGVELSVRPNGKACLVLRDDVPAVAALGQRYDREHREYRAQQGHQQSGISGDDRWQALIAQQTAENDRSPG